MTDKKLMDEMMRTNKRLIDINNKLIEINNGWEKIADQLMTLLKAEIERNKTHEADLQ
jgi:hypothetical protein